MPRHVHLDTLFAINVQNPVRMIWKELRGPSPVQWHMHYALEIGVVIAGRYRQLTPRSDRVFGRGEVWLSAMYEPHGWQIVSKKMEVLLISFLPDILAPFRFREAPGLDLRAPFLAAPADRPELSRSAKARMLAAARGITDEFGRTYTRSWQSPAEGGTSKRLAATDNYYHLWRRLRVRELLGLLLKDWQPPREVGETRRLDAFQCVHRVFEFLHEQIRFVTEEEVARAVGVSPAKLRRVFKSVLGENFAAMALRHRLNAAATEVVGSDLPIKAIAARWGFTDSSHLAHQFLKHYGHSPSDMRKQFAGKELD